HADVGETLRRLLQPCVGRVVEGLVAPSGEVIDHPDLDLRSTSGGSLRPSAGRRHQTDDGQHRHSPDRLSHLPLLGTTAFVLTQPQAERLRTAESVPGGPYSGGWDLTGSSGS